jgi:hypothetical protein
LIFNHATLNTEMSAQVPKQTGQNRQKMPENPTFYAKETLHPEKTKNRANFKNRRLPAISVRSLKF